MYNPYDDNKNTNETYNNSSATPESQNSQNSQINQANYHGQPDYQWQSPTPSQPQQPNTSWQQPTQTYWQGDYYRSYQQPGPHSSWSPKPPVVEKPKKEKKPSKGKKIFVKAVCGVLACCMISVGSVAGFASLVNNGYVTLNASGSTPAFTIAKVENNGTTATPTSVNGQLTQQEIAKKVIPSVVCIQNYQISSQLGFRGAAAGLDDSDISPAGEGSGIIASSDGYIITNAHVVKGATSLSVITSDGQKYEAKLIGSDEMTDLALIKIEATGLTPAEFGSSDDLEVADQVMAVGNPGGMEFNSSVTIGYVSALNREMTDSSTGASMKYIQTDAAINPGNSGGALVNMYGQVIGINSAKIVDTSFEGIGFAIPINTAQPIISDLKEYGYVKDRPVLGISGQYVDAMISRFYGLTTGMYVDSISNPSVSSAGIQEGDVITQIDGQDITSSSSIKGVIRDKKPGDAVTLKVVRPNTGSTFTATVTLTESTGQS